MLIKVNKEIRERGLCRKLVENGFGDVKLRIGYDVIISIKSILMNGNEIIKKLIEDVKFSGILELYEECSETGYFEMEKYYSGGDLNINGKNVCDILMFCICYNDDEIYNDCIYFIINNINDEILLKLIHICNIFPNSLKEIEDFRNMQFERRGYKYLYNNEYFIELEINNLKDLLCLDNVIIRNETWLLNKLFEWYKLKINYICNKNNDFKNMFKYMIEEHIDSEKINKRELKNDINEIMEELNIKLVKNRSVNYIDLCKIEDENVQCIIINNFEEDDGIRFNEEEIEILSNIEEDKLNNIIMSLLEIKNIRLIEIVLMIIMTKNEPVESIIYWYLFNDIEYINNIEKRNMISKLCLEYNENPRNRTIRCLCLFADEKKNIITIENLCGNEVLYRILNEECSLNEVSQKVIIDYLKEMKLSKDDEEIMLKIITNKNILKILIKEITSFSYPYSEYSFGMNEEISIIPSFEGENCEFSINPPLPSGITFDKESGIIHGKVDKEMEENEYEIICKNVLSEKKFKILLEFIDIKFTESYKNPLISISNGGKVITNTKDGWNHCYLNLLIENGVYHIKYQFHQNNNNRNDFMLGLSTDYTYSGNHIYNELTTFNYYAYGGKSYDITPHCHIGTIVNKNPNFNHGDGSVYEITVDMNKRELWISHNNSSPVLLVKDLPSPLYPYAIPATKQTSIELLSFYHQN